MELSAKLRRAQTRLLWRVFRLRLAMSIGTVLLLAGAFMLAVAWLQIQLDALPVLLIATGVSVCAAALLTALSDTSYLRTAKVLEQADPSLHARLSTAIELARAGANHSPIRQAQLNDATEHAGNINATENISLRIPSHFVAFALSGMIVLAGCIVLSTSIRQRQSEPVQVTGLTPDLTDDEQSNLASSLQQLAEMFTPESEAEADTYLESIGRQLQELGTRLDADEVSRDQLTIELERLLQHTRTALQLQDVQEAGTQQLNLTELLEAALREVRSPDESLLTEQVDPGAEDKAQSLESGPEAAEAATEDGPAGEQPLSLEEMLAAENEPEWEPNRPPATGDQSTGSFGSYFDHQIDERTMAELNARAMEQQALSQAAGEAIGASAESRDGASSLAGDGTDELFGSEAAAQLNAERIEQLSVNEETDPEGRHVRIEVNPVAQFTEVFVTPLGATVWSRSTETEVTREALMPDHRLVTARYHTPEQSE